MKAGPAAGRPVPRSGGRAALLVVIVACSLRVCSAGPAAAQTGSLEERYRFGLAAFQQGRVLAALEALGSVAAEDPDYRDVQLQLAQVCLAAGLVRAAKEHADRAVATDPANPYAAFLLGFTLYQSSRWFEAADALSRAHSLAPQNPHPLLYRGLARLELGRAEEARRDLEQARRRAPGDPAIDTGLAELDLAAGRFDVAERRLRAVLEQQPDAIEARLLLARVLFQSDRPREAAPVARQVVEAAPRRSDALYLLAQSLLRGGEREAGREWMERFRSAKAREEELKVLELEVRTNPGDLQPRLRLTRLYLEGGDVGNAVLHLAVLRQQRPDHPEVARLSSAIERLRAGEDSPGG